MQYCKMIKKEQNIQTKEFREKFYETETIDDLNNFENRDLKQFFPACSWVQSDQDDKFWAHTFDTTELLNENLRKQIEVNESFEKNLQKDDEYIDWEKKLGLEKRRK